jgi:hypothetical protein
MTVFEKSEQSKAVLTIGRAMFLPKSGTVQNMVVHGSEEVGGGESFLKKMVADCGHDAILHALQAIATLPCSGDLGRNRRIRELFDASFNSNNYWHGAILRKKPFSQDIFPFPN